MSNRKGRERIAGNYKVKEPINNFKLRVKIAQEKPLLAELLENEEDTRDSNFLQEEDRIFSWQEKVFSTFEAKFYSDEKNCLTEFQKDYHHEITENNIAGSLLYSYVDSDSYYPDNNLLTKPYRSLLSMRNEKALPALHNRKPFHQRYNKTVVDNEPKDVRIRSNHYIYTECSRMYLIADLSRQDDSRTNDDLETLLCTITYDRFHKTLTIDPDFTNDRHYSVSNSNGIEFSYWIENLSEKESLEESEKRIDDLRREIKERLIDREAEIPHSIHFPPSNLRKIFLTIDIMSAHDFNYDGLFVTYYIDLPENWNSNDSERLIGRTQRCNLQKKSAYFSYTTSLSLECQSNDVLSKNRNPPLYPRLLISVSSLDSWTRYRTEGYAALPLPLYSGVYDFNLQTWRATGSIVNTLRRFFTGGTYELEDITYCGIPTGYTGTALNKNKLKVITSGSVKIRLNLAHQTHPSVTRDLHLDKIYSIGTDTFMNNIESVFEQFKAARERMIQIRNFNSQ